VAGNGKQTQEGTRKQGPGGLGAMDFAGEIGRDPEAANPPSEPASNADQSPSESTFALPHPTPGAGRYGVRRQDDSPCEPQQANSPQQASSPGGAQERPQLWLPSIRLSELLSAVASPRDSGARSSLLRQQRHPAVKAEDVCDQIRKDAESDAQRIREDALAEAALILARADQIRKEAESDAQRIRVQAKSAVSVLGVERRHDSMKAIDRASEARDGSLPMPQRDSLAKAERCLAFMDKMVCLNFLSATQQVALGSEDSVEITRNDAEFMLRAAGFSEDDIFDIIDILVKDDELMPHPSGAAASPSTEGECPHQDENPSEDAPSTPSMRASDDKFEALVDATCESKIPDMASEASPSRAARLHAAIRKHPILNWLKKHEPIDASSSHSTPALSPPRLPSSVGALSAASSGVFMIAEPRD
jgi:hypothetical protein